MSRPTHDHGDADEAAPGTPDDDRPEISDGHPPHVSPTPDPPGTDPSEPPRTRATPLPQPRVPVARESPASRGRHIARRLAAPLITLVLALAALVAFGTSVGHTDSARPRAPLAAPDLPRPDTAAPVPPAHGPGITATDIADLAARRSQALATGDEQAFLADLDPDLPDLVAGQRRLFANLARVPFDHAAYRVETVQTMPATDERTTAYVDVSFDHRITRADTAMVGEGYRWTLTRSGAGTPLRVSAVDGTPYDGAGYTYARDYPAPWDNADLTVARRDHIVVLADPATAPGAEALADAAEEAARADIDTWADGGPDGVAPGFVIVPVADRDTFYRLYGGRTGEHGEESGLTYALRTAGPPLKTGFGGARIVLDTTSGWFTSPNPRRLGELLRHEMAHALVTPLRVEVPDQDQPVWVVEGFADWLALHGRTLIGTDELAEARSYVETGRFTGALPTDAELYQADTVGNAAAYEFAHLAIRRIEEIGGRKAVYAFVTDVYTDPAPDAVDAALERATHGTRAEFEKDWAARVRELASVESE